jgi:hypothetical protein
MINDNRRRVRVRIYLIDVGIIGTPSRMLPQKSYLPLSLAPSRRGHVPLHRRDGAAACPLSSASSPPEVLTIHAAVITAVIREVMGGSRLSFSIVITALSQG